MLQQNSITGLIAAYAGGIAEVVGAGARAPITASGSFSVPVSLNPSTVTLKLSPPPNTPYQPLSLSVTVGPGATNVTAAISGALSIVGSFIGIPGQTALGTNAAGYAVPGTGGGGNTFGPADYGVTTPDTFTFPAAVTIDTDTGDFTVAANNVNLTSLAAMNFASGASLDLQCSGVTGDMLISTNGGKITVNSGADGDALDILASAIDGSITMTANANISIDAGGTLEISGSPIQCDGQVKIAAGNGTALIATLGAAPTANLVAFNNHSNVFVSGVNKTADFVLSATSGAPSDAPVARTIRFDVATGILYIYNGTAWKSITSV